MPVVMKINHIYLIIAVMCALCAPQAGAVTKAADELRVYLNAGHGSWGPDDRPVATIPYPALSSTGRPDTCGFYETNTDMWKVYAMKNALVNMGVQSKNIMLSRDKNGPYPYVSGATDVAKYNRNLSEICEEVDANNMDMFLSIHSNAASNVLTNYGLFIYRGYDKGVTGDAGYTGNAVEGSYDMASTIWEDHYMDEIDPQSLFKRTGSGPSATYSKYLKGDITFYGSYSTRSGTSYKGYLGVLKHGVPGLLIEGFFHTYGPARHRALNEDYCRQEGIRTARGIARYFGIAGETTGYIMGSVKDAVNSLENSSQYKYISESVDSKAPINGATVQLYNSSGSKVGTYTTDNNYNGVFVFSNLAPGDYTVKVIKNGFADNSASLTVSANATAYAIVYLSEGSGSTIDDDDIITNDPISELEFENDGGTTYAGITGNVISTAQHGSTTAVLTDAPALYTINNSTRTLTTVPITGIYNSGDQGNSVVTALSAIAFTADGYLVACNKTHNCFSSAYVPSTQTQMGTLQFYIWNSLSEAPQKWVSTQSSARFYEAITGGSLNVCGQREFCVLTTTANTAQGDQDTYRLLSLTVTDDAITKTVITRGYTKTALGANVSIASSPRAGSNVILDGEVTKPIEIDISSADNSTNGGTIYEPQQIGGIFTDAGTPAASNHATFFNIGKRAVMAAPLTSAEGVNTGVTMYDFTSGLGTATAIATTGTALNSASTAYTAVHAFIDNDGKINMYLVKDNSIVRFYVDQDTPDDPEVKDTTPVRGIFAYGLGSTANADDSYTFTYGANNNATETYIVFTDAETGETVGEVKVENAKVTVQTDESTYNNVTLTQEQLPGSEGQTLNWSVRLKGRPVAETGVKLNSGTKYDYTRACVVVDNSPESDYFGYFYVNDWVSRASASNGITRWYQGSYSGNESDWDRTATPSNHKFNGGTTLTNSYNLATDAQGNVYLGDWGDATSGVYIFDPHTISAAADPAPTQFFSGTRASTGLWYDNGVAYGSSTSGVGISGKGADTRLFIVLEDMDRNGNNYTTFTGSTKRTSPAPYYGDVAYYNAGNAGGTITAGWQGKAPSGIIQSGSTIDISNRRLQGDDKGGIWVSLNRAAGQNNTQYPALVYYDKDGNQVLNLGNTAYNTVLTGCAAGGFAVSSDNRKLAIVDASGNVHLYNLEWNGNTPTASHQSSFAADVKDGSGTSHVNNGVYQMSFDWGGNLYVAGKSLGIYSIADDNNTHTTPAKATLTVTKLGKRSLAQIAQSEGVTAGSKYRLSNEYLTCVYVDKTGQVLYCKDNNEYATKSVASASQTDYMKEIGKQTADYDQSNWVAVNLPEALSAEQIEAIKNHRIVIDGVTVNVIGNNEITLSVMPEVGDAEQYNINTYIVPNFNSEYSGDGDSDYFFVSPKPMEYAIIDWAMWSAADMAFIVPPRIGSVNLAELSGGFTVSMDMVEDNDDTDPSHYFEDGKVYCFPAVIKFKSGGSGAPRRATAVSGTFTVSPTVITEGSIVTSVGDITVAGNRSIVKISYFNVAGMEMSEAPQSGVYLEVTTYDDGTRSTRKLIK